jgi:general secretion pathway protein D
VRAAALLGLILVARAAFGQESAPGPGEGLVLNFRDAEIAAVVQTIARATGQRFVHDSPLRGRVTMVLEDEVSPAEALEVLNAALLLAGYASIPAPGGALKLLEIEAAKGAAPWIHRDPSPDAARLVTTFVRLEAAEATELAQILGQESRASVIVPYPSTNGLIIAAPEDRLASMLELVRALDQASASDLVVLPLRYAQAAAVAGQIETVFRAGDAPELPLEVVVDERTNSLVVSGAKSRVLDVRRYLAMIDVPSRSPSGIHVVRIVNADAEEIAGQLQTLDLSGASRPGAASGPGGRLGALAAQPPFTVAAEPSTNSLVIRAEPKVFAELATLISELDHIPPRVGIEIYVWDVDTARTLELGFDALVPIIVPDEAGDTAAFAAIGNLQDLLNPSSTARFLARYTREPVLIPIIGIDGQPVDVLLPEGAAQLRAGQGDVVLHALARPFLLAASGEEQQIFSGDQVPVPVSSAGTTGDSTLGGDTPSVTDDGFITSQNIERQDVGIDLRVKPVAVSDDLVALELRLEVSTVVEGSAHVGIDPNELGPTLRQFQIETTVRLVDGGVVLFGSAPQDSIASTERGVPYLKDIPILGWFFKSTFDAERRRRLVAAVQVSEVHSPAEQRADSIVRRLALERHEARTSPLDGLTLSPYALLVATRASANDAQRVAQEIAGLDGRPVIVPWQSDGEERFDVYLVDFDEIGALGEVSVELRRRGFTTRLEFVTPPVT